MASGTTAGKTLPPLLGPAPRVRAVGVPATRLPSGSASSHPPVPAWQGRALLRAPGFPLELPRGGPAPIPHLLWKLGRSRGGEQGGPSLGSSLVMEGQRHLWAAGSNKHLLGVSVAGGGCPSLATAPVGTSGGGRTGVRSDRCKVGPVAGVPPVKLSQHLSTSWNELLLTKQQPGVNPRPPAPLPRPGRSEAHPAPPGLGLQPKLLLQTPLP